MPIPIKLNKFRFKINLPGVVEDPRILINKNIDDGDFEKAISFFKIDKTMKITEKNRQPITDKYLTQYLDNKSLLSILEVGASCGVNSLNLIKEISNSLERFFITDLFISIPFIKKDNFTFFYNPKSEKCVMAVSDYFAFYIPTETKIPFLNKISEEVLSRAPKLKKKMSLLNFIHPIIREMQENDSRIKTLDFNVFDNWELGKVDAIKCANVLNLSYFNEQKLNIALESLTRALKVNGILAITRNLSSTEKEIGSIFQLRKNKKLKLLKEINGGIDFKIEKRFF